MANTAFDHASALTIPGSTTNNGLVRWGDTTGTSFGNITGITSDGSNLSLLTRGEVRFSDADSSHYVAFEAPATVSTTYTMTLPADLPAANEYLKVTSYSGGAGVLEWASVSADTNTTYLTSWVDSSANAILRLTPSSGSADDLTIVAGTNITLTPSGDNLTIDAAGGGSNQHVNLYTTATQSLATGSITPIIFQGETTDTNTMHTGCEACVTIKVAGTYAVIAATLYTGNCSGARDLYLYNGSTIVANQHSALPPMAGNFMQQLTHMGKFAACDVLQFRARQVSGGALNVLNCGNAGRLQVTLLYED